MLVDICQLCSWLSIGQAPHFGLQQLSDLFYSFMLKVFCYGIAEDLIERARGKISRCVGKNLCGFATCLTSLSHKIFSCICVYQHVIFTMLSFICKFMNS